MMIKAEKIWLDGALVPWDEANVHVLTHTLHYGLGVFEGIRAYRRADGRSAVFRLRDHVERMVHGARMITLPLDYSVDDLFDACLRVCRVNRLPECYIRPLAFVGSGQMGVAAVKNPTRVAIAAWPWGAYLGDEGLQRGVRLKTSSFMRPHASSQLHKAKVVGHYVNSILAKREAMADGYDEALLLDANGLVSEASGENVFCVIGGEVFTPQFGSAILGGITRDTVIVLAREMGYHVREESVTRGMIYMAEEVFMSGTAAEITPVREVDRRTIGEGRPGPITRAIQERYFDLVKGSDTTHQEWLSYYEVADL